MKKKISSYVLTTVGLVLLVVGLYMTKAVNNPQGFMRAFPFICVGLGCGIFGQGMGNIISKRAMKNSPEIQKQIEIEKNDERNVTIINSAKAKAYDMMTFVFGALMLSFALMSVDVIVILLLVFAYLFVHGYAIYYRCKYDKEM